MVFVKLRYVCRNVNLHNFLDFYHSSIFQVLFLAGCVLYAVAYSFLTLLKKSDHDEDDFLPVSWEDAIVYQTSFAICAFSLAVSAGSALLLPISSISNEILHRYPSSWYIQWLNASLIHGIWNLIFVLSNASL